MKISKKDAWMWFSFFAQLDEEEELMPKQMELVYATFAQIEDAVDARIEKWMSEIKGLQTINGRTYFVGPAEKFARGCRSCMTGTGLTAVRKTSQCNIQCKFCYNYGELEDCMPIGEGLWEIGGTKFHERDLDLLLSIQEKPTGISYVYLEPFMEIEAYYGVIQKFHAAGIYQHMYTNGTLATEENLKALAEAGLDELRFNLGATNASDQVIDAIGIAKKYIKYVGIETPMTPEYFKVFMEKKEKILATGVDFMNCAELHLNQNNIWNYMGENMYVYRQGYVSPIWSRELTLRLMKMAAEENWNVVVHDCSNRTKFARGLNLKAKEGAWFGASNYGSEFSRPPFAAFLPILQDETFPFITEEELPQGYRPGELII